MKLFDPFANTRSRTEKQDCSFAHVPVFGKRRPSPDLASQAVRSVWPERLPLFVRLSASDWAEGGWDLEQAIQLSRKLIAAGVDLIDVSSGGAVPGVRIPLGPGYHVKFAESIRKQAGIATGAVGLIYGTRPGGDDPDGGTSRFDLLAREMLRDPYWPRRAAKILGEKIKPPVQSERAW